MDEANSLAWGCVIAGFVLGSVGVCVPGFPGSAVGLLGLAAFAGLTEFEVVPRPALLVAALCVVAGSLGQLLGPVAAGRAFGGSAGAATGAVVGVGLGSLVPVPGAAWLGAVVGASTLGLLGSRRELGAWVRGVVGTSSGCMVGMAADGVALLAVGAVFAICEMMPVADAG